MVPKTCDPETKNRPFSHASIQIEPPNIAQQAGGGALNNLGRNLVENTLGFVFPDDLRRHALRLVLPADVFYEIRLEALKLHSTIRVHCWLQNL